MSPASWPGRRKARAQRRVVFPFAGDRLPAEALDAAIRLAQRERATLVPAYLALVPAHLDINAPIPVSTSESALALQEAIERRAARAGVPVDARIERGRSTRHALTDLLEREPEAHVLLPAGEGCMSQADIDWVLANVDNEVIVLRPRRDA